MGGKQSTDTSARASPSSQSKDNNNDIPVLYDMETGLAIMGLDATGRDSDKMKQFRERFGRHNKVRRFIIEQSK